ADMRDRVTSTSSVAIDPSATQIGSKCRSAAVSCCSLGGAIFLSKEREALGSEAPPVHYAARRRGRCAATRRWLIGWEASMLMTGKEYLDSIRDGRRVYVGGELVEDVTTHAAFRNAARSFAMIYDRKRDFENRDVMTFEEDGETFSTYFL